MRLAAQKRQGIAQAQKEEHARNDLLAAGKAAEILDTKTGIQAGALYCVECQKSFKSTQGLGSHNASKHADIPKPIPIPPRRHPRPYTIKQKASFVAMYIALMSIACFSCGMFIPQEGTVPVMGCDNSCTRERERCVVGY